ncbi:spore germination protein [Jeotgalibacillus soli]|uniref:Spore germination protein KA n=1 Tax=Jeotgalibacillus soli TaxID=889306 RepID=A0A0C2VUW2_9BACL|nr:spore germination protein [Jeotgalibacillus soli]KIL48221.1 spore germination protein KA [Jeotgalibacillus soli]
MPSFFKRHKRKKIDKVHNNKKEQTKKEDSKENSSQNAAGPLNRSLAANLEVIKQKTGSSPDVIIRRLMVGGGPPVEIAIGYVEGLVEEQSVNDFLIKSILNNDDIEVKNGEEILNKIEKDIIALGSIERVNDWEKLFQSMLSGKTIILIDGSSEAISANTRGGEKRSILEPSTQNTIRGSRESFTEAIGTNIALVRRIINNPNLWIEPRKLGTITQTDVSVMYINGIVKDEIVEEVRKRLDNIKLDSILESGYIEQMIQDQTMTTFPTIFHTERPDMVAGNLLEGRVAIFINGTPFVLLAPAVFIQFFQTPEDYYIRSDIATATRFLRVITFFISLMGPAIYVAATTFHQEMIPTQFLLIIAAQRDVVPFPAFVEALIMEVTFEILREAGIRMPKIIGPTISIVGALVIGQASVQAGIVSPAMVIVVSITAIASFATPSFPMAISIRLIRFLFMLCAATFGFYGIVLAFITLLAHLCGLRSFGVPYMSPLTPFIPENAGDTIFRRPWWDLRERPRLIGSKNTVRKGNNQKPEPPAAREMSSRKGDGDEI